ncbi:uncharacterized protein V6R79_010111 [Siganus canaliculatus]
MTFQVSSSLHTLKALTSEGSNSCGKRGPDVGYPAHRNFSMEPVGGQAAFRENVNMKKFPVIPPFSRSKDWKALVSVIAAGSPNIANDDTQDSENNDPEKDTSGRHFLFDEKCVRLEKARTVIPPLVRDYRVARPGNLRPFSLSTQLSHGHAGRPFTLSYPERYELNTSSPILFPSALVLNGRHTFSLKNCKLSRPKVNYPTCNLPAVIASQKSQTYPDPMVGASRSFLHRISELSSQQGETVRQEKLKKMRNQKKPPS